MFQQLVALLKKYGIFCLWSLPNRSFDEKIACSVTSTIMTTQELSATDLQDILHFTIYLARKAGNLILEGSKEIQKAGSSIGEKSNAVDLVTKYDVAVEELVKKEIAEQYSHFEL